MAGPDRAHSPDAPTADAHADQESIDIFVHPSVGRINALAIGHPQAPIVEVTDILRAHPEDYEACMRAIHRLWGNQVAAQCAIIVPHITLAAPGRPNPLTPDAAETAGGERGGESPVDADVDPITGEADVSASAGPVTGHVTAQPPNRLTGEHGHVTGGSVEVAGEPGPNTHAGASVGVDASGTVSGDANVTHRVSPNVAVGGAAHVEASSTGEVRAQGGGSVRLRLDDHTALRIAGGVDSQGVLNQEVALEILQDSSRRVPISDDGHRRLRIILRASEPTQIGQDAQGSAPNVSLGIGGTF